MTLAKKIAGPEIPLSNLISQKHDENSDSTSKYSQESNSKTCSNMKNNNDNNKNKIIDENTYLTNIENISDSIQNKIKS